MGVYKKIMIRRVKSTFGNQEGEIYFAVTEHDI